jgi:hypothetical protein
MTTTFAECTWYRLQIKWEIKKKIEIWKPWQITVATTAYKKNTFYEAG